MKTLTIFKNTILVLSLILLSHMIKAQDVITLNSGKEFNVKILEVSDTDVKFKKTENLEGPIYTFPKADIFMIKYENGTKDVINKAPSQPVTVKTNTLGDDIPVEKQLRFGGPRIGYTYMEVGGTSAKFLSDRGKQPFISQFGWQFETRVFTLDSNGGQGIVEFIPMIGGMEQGLFLPSASFLIGFRTGGKRGYEIAVGPNLSLSGFGIVIAAGTSFKVGRVNFPVNLAFVPSVGKSRMQYNPSTMENYQEITHTGFRLSLVVGFNTIKK